MLITRVTLPVAFVALLGAATPPNVIRLTSSASSTLTIEGSSNVHEWSCKATQVDAAVMIDGDYAKATGANIGTMLKSVDVKVPVKSIKCGKGAMDNNLYKALKADDKGTISYITGTFQVIPGATPSTFTIKAPGQLTIAGAQRPVTIEVKAERLADGRIHATGSVPLKMTDFGINPPTALMGTLRTKNELTVAIDLTVGQ